MPPVIKQKAKKSTKKDVDVVAKEDVVSGQLQKKINKKQPAKDERGVVFIKHLPHGFFEQQLKNYFEQFGKVTRMRLARSKTTGGSKGYAFVEFEFPEVAQVAAETMDNYLMFKKIVKAAYIPPEKQQYNYFRSTLRTVKNKSGRTVWVSSKTAALQRKVKQHNDWSDENFQKRTSKQLKKLKKLGKKCAHLGIDINKIIKGESPISVADSEDGSAGSSKTKKRKNLKESSDEKQSKKQPKLEDLLGNTIQEDSEDEDYIDVQGENEESIEDEESSDEDSYGFLKDVEEEEDSEEGSDNEKEENDSTEEEIEIPVKKSKPKFSKSLKSSNIERFDQMLKRKPHTGGVQKSNKKPSKPTAIVKPKNKMQLSQAKEFAKPFGNVKGKGAKVAKAIKKSKKVQ